MERLPVSSPRTVHLLHAVLFLSALISAVFEDPRLIDFSFGGRMRAAVIWCLTMALFVALAFAPVLVAGVGGDFDRSLGVVAYGGPYSKTSGAQAVTALFGEFNYWRTIVAP
jgi:hypothetical protein